MRTGSEDGTRDTHNRPDGSPKQPRSPRESLPKSGFSLPKSGFAEGAAAVLIDHGWPRRQFSVAAAIIAVTHRGVKPDWPVEDGGSPRMMNQQQMFGRRGKDRTSRRHPSSCPWCFVPLAGSCFTEVSFVSSVKMKPELISPQALPAGLAVQALRPESWRKRQGRIQFRTLESAFVWLMFYGRAFPSQPATPSFQRASSRPCVVLARSRSRVYRGTKGSTRPNFNEQLLPPQRL